MKIKRKYIQGIIRKKTKKFFSIVASKPINIRCIRTGLIYTIGNYFAIFYYTWIVVRIMRRGRHIDKLNHVA